PGHPSFPARPLPRPPLFPGQTPSPATAARHKRRWRTEGLVECGGGDDLAHLAGARWRRATDATGRRSGARDRRPRDPNGDADGRGYGGHTSRTRPLRVAVIGCGRIGTGGHLPAFARAAQAGLCTLVGVCDVDPRRAEAAARPYGLPAFTSTEALLARLHPDVVSIATLPSGHRALALQALDAGCHVLCEKPVAMDAGEAAEMVAAAGRAGR